MMYVKMFQWEWITLPKSVCNRLAASILYLFLSAGVAPLSFLAIIASAFPFPFAAAASQPN